MNGRSGVDLTTKKSHNDNFIDLRDMVELSIYIVAYDNLYHITVISCELSHNLQMNSHRQEAVINWQESRLSGGASVLILMALVSSV